MRPEHYQGASVKQNEIRSKIGGCNYLGRWKPSNNNGQPLKDFTEKKEEFRLPL